jgi:hypothetical protein
VRGNVHCLLFVRIYPLEIHSLVLALVMRMWVREECAHFLFLGESWSSRVMVYPSEIGY